MYQTKHFVTGNFTSHATHVDDKTYSLILDNVVKATCDIFLVRQGDGCSNAGGPARPMVLMGERVGLPHADWWIPGGRMMPGETAAKCCKRVLHRELGLHLGDDDVAAQRVRTVSHFTFVWDSRTQAPIQNGTCDVSIILRVDVTENESSCIALNHKEYKQLEWRDLEEQLVIAQPNGRPLHPALLQGMTDLSAMLKWDGLMALLAQQQRLVQQQPEGSGGAVATSAAALDAELVQRLLQFCEQRGEIIGRGASSSVQRSPVRGTAWAGSGASPPPQPDGYVHKHHGDTHATSYHPPRNPPQQ